jgi:hypothetical protein
MLHLIKGMCTEPATLLKRSDGPFFRVHIGHDYESVAKTLSAQQAFAVSPILIGPCSSLDTADSVDEAIQTLCKPLQNSWFQAPSTDIAAIVLLQALSSTPDPKAENRQEETPNFAEPMQEEKDSGQAEAPNCTESHTGDGDATLWNYVVPCNAKDASRAAEIRATLIQELGKKECKRILSYCVTTVAKDGQGRKNRVMKANGKLLKLKQ